MKQINSIKYLLAVLLLLLFIKTYGQHTDRIRVLSYNILEGMKLDTTKQKTVFVDWIKSFDPDIMALQEVNKFKQRQLEDLARSYGHPYAVLLKEYGYPVALTSKYPIVNVDKVIDNMSHGFICAKVGGYNIIVLHLNPHKHWKRSEEIALVLETIKQSGDKEKWLLMGDFNSISPLDADGFADGKLLETMKAEEAGRPGVVENLVDGKSLDYSIHQAILDRGFVDVAKKKYPKFESSCETKSFLLTHPYPAKKRYDFIYVSSNLEKNYIDASIIKDSFTDNYSDHYPVLLDLKK